MISLLCVFLFSFSLLFSSDLVFFWLLLELVSLSLIPSFFYTYGGVSFYTLFIYIVVSSLSSSFMLLGIIDSGLIPFFVLGYLMKFGLFPFFGWVYSVVLGSNALVIWLLSTFVKVPFVYICFFLGGFFSSSYFVAVVASVVTFLVLSIFFWVYNYSWRCCWTHMMISSSCIIVVMSFNISLNLLVWFFFVYLIWCTFTLLFLFFCESCGFILSTAFLSNSGQFGIFFWFGFIFLLLSTPISFSLFYKVFISCCIYSCGWVFIIFWVIYSLSEQFFFIKYLLSSFICKFSFNWFFII
uniref:NADH dehydrogenase subunit 2 n=1 Tax=Diplostomum ardeae TaxID=1702217 RepID=A0A6M8NV15_9TREM|nr:NADH dehydrogenase subunit 2 [Diplostomum ardeae]QKG04348.1 NADH dehydrogenase subunit 2 [Diplostomum ardeae]